MRHSLETSRAQPRPSAASRGKRRYCRGAISTPTKASGAGSALDQKQHAGPAGTACRVDGRRYLRGRSHRLLVDRQDQVAALKALLGGVAVRIDRGDDHAARRRRQVERACDLRHSAAAATGRAPTARAVAGVSSRSSGSLSLSPPSCFASSSSVGRWPTVTFTVCRRAVADDVRPGPSSRPACWR